MINFTMEGKFAVTDLQDVLVIELNLSLHVLVRHNCLEGAIDGVDPYQPRLLDTQPSLLS
jgi:hypothetical protein